MTEVFRRSDTQDGSQFGGEGGASGDAIGGQEGEEGGWGGGEEEEGWGEEDEEIEEAKVSSFGDIDGGKDRD